MEMNAHESVAPPVVRFVALDAELAAPALGRPDDAAVDLRAVHAVRLAPGERATVGTGVAVALPPRCCGLVVPRSGLAARHGISIVNAPGLVDANYRGEVKVVLVNLGAEPVFLERGERIAQLLVVAVATTTWQQVDELDDTDRAGGGFGSSGRL